MYGMYRNVPNRIHKIDKEEENKIIRRRLKAVQPKVNTGLAPQEQLPQNYHPGRQSYLQPEVISVPYPAKVEAKRNSSRGYTIYGRANAQTKYNGPYSTLLDPPEKCSPYMTATTSVISRRAITQPFRNTQLSLNSTQASNKGNVFRNNRIPQPTGRTTTQRYVNKQKTNRLNDSRFQVDADKDENDRSDSDSESVGDSDRENDEDATDEIAVADTQRHVSKITLNEILPPRDLSDDSKSGDDNCDGKQLTPKTPTTFVGSLESSSDIELNQGSSENKYYSAMVIQNSCNVSPSSSVMIFNNLKELVKNKECSMQEDDIKLVEKVFKSDARHALLKERNPLLFKVLLKSKLEEIEAQETALKMALGQICGSDANAKDKECRREMEKEKEKEKEKQKQKEEEEELSKITPKCVRICSDKDKQKPSPQIPPLSIWRDWNNKCSPAELIFGAEKEDHELTPRLISADAKPETLAAEKVTVAVQAFDSARSVSHQIYDQRTKHFYHHLIRAQPTSPALREPKRNSNKPGVDVTFTNITSTQEEIVVLHALGNCLEATIKRTGMPPPPLRGITSVERKLDSAISEASKASTSLPAPKSTPRWWSSPKPLYKVQLMGIAAVLPGRIALAVYMRGIRLDIGLANEFRIEQKPLVDLKNDCNSKFYVPQNPDERGGALTCTTYDKMSRNPCLLLRYIKGKDPKIPFNFLEQDPIFFQSFIMPTLVKSGNFAFSRHCPEKIANAVNKSHVKELHEGGDSFSARKIVKRKQCAEHEIGKTEVRHTTTKKTVKEKSKSPQLPKGVKPPPQQQQQQKQKQSQPQRRQRCLARTPMPMDQDLEPKNRLIKTIIVGGVHMFLFLLLIMAFTYPEFHCSLHSIK